MTEGHHRPAVSCTAASLESRDTTVRWGMTKRRATRNLLVDVVDVTRALSRGERRYAHMSVEQCVALERGGAVVGGRRTYGWLGTLRCKAQDAGRTQTGVSDGH